MDTPGKIKEKKFPIGFGRSGQEEWRISWKILKIGLRQGTGKCWVVEKLQEEER